MTKPKPRQKVKKALPTRAQRVKAFAKFLGDETACSPARAWAHGKTVHQAWRECERKDWLLWLISRAKIKHKLWRGERVCACPECFPESLAKIKREIKLPAIFPWERK